MREAAGAALSAGAGPFPGEWQESRGANFANSGLVSGAARAGAAEADAGRTGRVGPVQEPEEAAAGGTGPSGPGRGFGLGREARRRGREAAGTGARRTWGKDAGEAPRRFFFLRGRLALPPALRPALRQRGGWAGAGTRESGLRSPQLLLLEAAGAGSGAVSWDRGWVRAGRKQGRRGGRGELWVLQAPALAAPGGPLSTLRARLPSPPPSTAMSAPASPLQHPRSSFPSEAGVSSLL